MHVSLVTYGAWFTVENFFHTTRGVDILIIFHVKVSLLGGIAHNSLDSLLSYLSDKFLFSDGILLCNLLLCSELTWHLCECIMLDYMIEAYEKLFYNRYFTFSLLPL